MSRYQHCGMIYVIGQKYNTPTGWHIQTNISSEILAPYKSNHSLNARVRINIYIITESIISDTVAT